MYCSKCHQYYPHTNFHGRNSLAFTFMKSQRENLLKSKHGTNIDVTFGNDAAPELKLEQ